MLRVKDIQNDLGLNNKVAYKLVKSKGFPKIIINMKILFVYLHLKRLYVIEVRMLKKDIKKWLVQQKVKIVQE